jgi:hypothetical protein
MTKSLLVLCVLLSATVVHIRAASSYTLDFEDIPSDNTSTIRNITYTNGDYLFSAPGNRPGDGGLIYRDSSLIQPNPDPGIFERPVNGTKYLASFTSGMPWLRRADGGTFTLFGLDLAEYSSVFPEPWTVTLTGKFTGGSTITTIFTLDGHCDSLPNPPDFQSFTLGPQWTGLTEVRFLTTVASFPGIPLGASFDNIQVSGVPEPAVLTLTLPGLALWWWKRRRSRTRG